MKYVELYEGRYITVANVRRRIVFVITEPDGTLLYQTEIAAPSTSATDGALHPEVEAVLDDLRRRIEEEDFGDPT